MNSVWLNCVYYVQKANEQRHLRPLNKQISETAQQRKLFNAIKKSKQKTVIRVKDKTQIEKRTRAISMCA